MKHAMFAVLGLSLAACVSAAPDQRQPSQGGIRQATDACLQQQGLAPTHDGESPRLTRDQLRRVDACVRRRGFGGFQVSGQAPLAGLDA